MCIRDSVLSTYDCEEWDGEDDKQVLVDFAKYNINAAQCTAYNFLPFKS